MHEMVEFTTPVTFICHFVAQEQYAQVSPMILPHYQCYFDPNDIDSTSPSGEFIRFQSNHEDPQKRSEIHGWTRIDAIRIDETLKVWEKDEQTEYELKAG